MKGRKIKGTQRVKRVISKFTSLINELDKGITEMDEEIGFNTLTIAGLEARNAVLSDTGDTARNVAKNLRKIVGE